MWTSWRVVKIVYGFPKKTTGEGDRVETFLTVSIKPDLRFALRWLDLAGGFFATKVHTRESLAKVKKNVNRVAQEVMRVKNMVITTPGPTQRTLM